MPENLFWYHKVSSAELARASVDKDILILAVAAPENHGPHLPLGTDEILGEAMAERLGRRLAERYPNRRVWLHPTWHLGGATIRGTGSVKVPSRILRKTLKHYMRRFLKQGFTHFVFLTGHGAVPHVGALDDVCAWLRRRSRPGRVVHAISPSSRIGGKVFFGRHANAVRRAGIELSDQEARDLRWDLHAGRVETSMVLAAAPETVAPIYRELPVIQPPSRWWLNGLERLFESAVRRIVRDEDIRQDVLHALWAGVQDFSWILRGRREGYVGMPHRASAAEGEILLDEITADIATVTADVFAGRRDPATTRSGAHLFRGLIAALALLIAGGLAGVAWWLF